jgi:hypothetical protein
VHDLRGDEDDTQGNHRFDRWTRHVYPAQRGGCKRDAMGNRERRDGEEDSLAIANDQQQCQHEQQMVDTTENVFYTEHQIGPGHLARTRRCFHRETRFSRQQSFNLTGAILPLDTHDDIRHTAGNAIDTQRLSDEATRAGNLPALDVGLSLNIPCG